MTRIVASDASTEACGEGMSGAAPGVPGGAGGMRILLVTTGLLTGGAEMQIAALAGQFTARGCDVAILNLLGQTEVPVDARVHVENLYLRPWALPSGLLRARDFVRAWRPDVVHSHMLKANLFARLLRLLCLSSREIPRLICTAHSVREGGWLMMKLYRLTDALCDLTTHVSQQAVDYYVKLGAVPKTRIRMMPNGLDLGRFSAGGSAGAGSGEPRNLDQGLDRNQNRDQDKDKGQDQPRDPQRQATRASLGLDEDAFAWLHVGRLVPEKAQSHLLAAFATVAEHRPEARLLIAGSGPLAAQLEAQARALGIDARVRFLGRRDDVPQLLQAADGFVLSSDVEGSPLVLAEAMACGLPTISTDVPGADALLGTLGRIVPRGKPAALARAMLVTMERPQTQAMRDSRRAHIAANFSLPEIAGRWLALYAAGGDARTRPAGTQA